MVTILLLLCRLLLRIFFRQVEIVGHEHVPARGKVMFALNHPNGLIDPLFILCHAGRRVSFLAKAPLFSMPVVGYFVRAFGCLPVYRKQDNLDPAQNRAMLERAVELLNGGNALALFPEGTSHSDPQLKPFRSGAARIALSAAAISGDVVKVVPVGLYYSTKQVFRSNALLLFGEPIDVTLAERDGHVEPAREQVQALTERLSQRVAELTLEAQSIDEVYLAKVAARVVVAANREQGLPVPKSMAEKLRFRQRLLLGHAKLEGSVDVARLVRRLRSYEANARALGLRVDETFSYSSLGVLRYLLKNLGWLCILLVPGTVGLISNYLTYRLVGLIAFRYSKAAVDVQATGKVLGGLLLFPVSWGVWGLLALVSFGAWQGLCVVLAMPLCAYAALLLVEVVTGIARRGNALWLSLTKSGFVRSMISERRSMRDELLRLAQALDERQ